MNTFEAEAAPAALPVRKTLRAKAFVATMALVAYVFGAALYVAMERASIYDSMQTLHELAKHEKALALTEAAVNGALLDVTESGSVERPEPAMLSEITLYMESCDKLLTALEVFDPRYALLQRAITRSYAELKAATFRANWLGLRESLARASSELEIRHRGLNQQRDDLTIRYHRQYDAVTIESLLLSLVGIAVFGAMVAWFFSRLATDIRQLESHARQIVRGARGVALPVARGDELGQLMHAVNQMSSDLEQRERQIELDTERRSHQEKMIAVGALAAGVAHEVNNPLAVIAGTAQELSALQGEELAQRVTEATQLILAQAQRAAHATRNLAEVAALQPTAFDWVDVNAMVRRVLQLMGYDKRHRHIEFLCNLATDLPAVLGPGAAIQQVLMQLMSLGCDALPTENGHAKVQVSTRHANGWIEIALTIPVPLDFNCPKVQRLLLLVRAIVEPLSAGIEMDQEAVGKQRLILRWPVHSGRAEQEGV